MLQVKRKTLGKRSEKVIEQTETDIFVNDSEVIGIRFKREHLLS